MKNPVSKEIEWFVKQIEALEVEFNVRKAQLFGKMAELLGVPAAPAKRKPGRPPKAFAAAPLAAPKRRGRKPGRIARPGRKRAGEGTLPDFIVEVLKSAGKPLNAREILDGLEKTSWQTSATNKQALVYKTLHRIHKVGTVAKAERGKFTVPK